MRVNGSSLLEHVPRISLKYFVELYNDTYETYGRVIFIFIFI